MAVENGIIKFVGSNAGANGHIRSGVTRVVDLKGNTVLPGIHDNHMHPLEAQNPVAGTCKLPSNTPPDDPELLSVFQAPNYCHEQQTGTTW